MKPRFYPMLNSVALVLKKFNQTIVDVYGHTDSTGDDTYNYNLSQRRALSVANYLVGAGRRFRAASPSPASARRGRSPTTARRRAARRTAASKSSCRR